MSLKQSRYKPLYDSIQEILKHGREIKDDRVIQLAVALENQLKTFEAAEPNQRKKVKFRTTFMDILHREDKHFAMERRNPLRQFIPGVYRNFYTTIFLSPSYKRGFFDRLDAGTPEAPKSKPSNPSRNR